MGGRLRTGLGSAEPEEEAARRPDAAPKGRRIHRSGRGGLTRRGVGSGDGEKNQGGKVGAGTGHAAILPETDAGPGPAAQRLPTRRGSPWAGLARAGAVRSPGPRTPGVEDAGLGASTRDSEGEILKLTPGDGTHSRKLLPGRQETESSSGAGPGGCGRGTSAPPPGRFRSGSAAARGSGVSRLPPRPREPVGRPPSFRLNVDAALM